MAYEKYAYATLPRSFTFNVFSLRSSSSSLCVVFCLFSYIAVVVAAVEVFHVSLAKRAVVVAVAVVAVAADVAVAAIVIYHACAVAAAVTHKPYITDITAQTHTQTQQDTHRALSALGSELHKLQAASRSSSNVAGKQKQRKHVTSVPTIPPPDFPHSQLPRKCQSTSRKRATASETGLMKRFCKARLHFCFVCSFHCSSPSRRLSHRALYAPAVCFVCLPALRMSRKCFRQHSLNNCNK